MASCTLPIVLIGCNVCKYFFWCTKDPSRYTECTNMYSGSCNRCWSEFPPLPTLESVVGITPHLKTWHSCVICYWKSDTGTKCIAIGLIYYMGSRNTFYRNFTYLMENWGVKVFIQGWCQWTSKTKTAIRVLENCSYWNFAFSIVCSKLFSVERMF